MASLILERVKPTEPSILEMVRAHYSHRDNVNKRPRTEKTSKTWWSNARLVVFSDPARTLVFAWQWPKDGKRIISTTMTSVTGASTSGDKHLSNGCDEMMARQQWP